MPRTSVYAAAIASLDKDAAAIGNARSGYTSELEDCAQEYYDRGHATADGRADALCCSAGQFVFNSADEDVITFHTECTWCGKHMGTGLDIDVAWMDAELALRAIPAVSPPVDRA